MNQTQAPRYRSHKIVQALKIKAFDFDFGGNLHITPEEEGFDQFVVSAKFIPKHRDGVPEVGWYWVRYDNNYESFSPAKAFEEGYTRLP